MHDTYNDTEYDTLSSKFLDTYTIHERYKNHRNWLCIQSSIHCSAPTKAAILYRVCIEVYRTRICSMDTTVDTRSIRLRYTFDTLRYKLWGKCTPIHGENPPSSLYIGVSLPHPITLNLHSPVANLHSPAAYDTHTYTSARAPALYTDSPPHAEGKRNLHSAITVS